MSIDPELRKILLRKLDRVLNPNFNSKFIWALLALGGSLILSPVGSAFAVNVEFKYKWISVVVSNVNDNALMLFVAGCVFVLLSAFLHFRSQNIGNHALENDKDRELIVELLHGLSVDINSEFYTERQKRSIFSNKKREIYAHLIKQPLNIPEIATPHGSSDNPPNDGIDLASEVVNYIETINRIIG